MRYLGIDYGTKRVGLALSDEGGTLAFPHSIVPNDSELLGTVTLLILNEGIGHVVIGESADAGGNANPVQAAIKEFANQLREGGIEVSFQKEFFTSVHARGSAGKESNSARQEKQAVAGPADASAAALILQRALDRKP